MKLAKAKVMAEMAADLALRRYPAALYDRSAKGDQLPPIFCLHSVTTDWFEPLCERLARSGIRTLSCDEYLQRVVQGPSEHNDNEILLTFDDGWGQMYSVAWPLMKKHGLKGVIYLIPGRIQAGERGDPRPTLEDVWAGRCDQQVVDSRDDSDQPLCTWDEVQRMHASGVFDFQSHTHRHERVFTGRDVIGFVTPDWLARTHINDQSMWPTSAGQSFASPPLGSPLFASAPRMSGAVPVPIDPELQEMCTAFVAQSGGAGFFTDPNWRSSMDLAVRTYHRAAAEGVARPPDPIDPDSVLDILTADLRDAKQAIESHLPGHVVRHVAWPWGVGSDLAVQAAQAAGYDAAYWGRLGSGLTGGRVANFKGTDPMQLARIGEDFLAMLPGKGRTSTGKLLLGKVRKNLG
ncbi:MAG: polysaccharide deacetylase family protein [Planctomycetota bacterium]